jgi:type II secretory pathway pseudopilin PulG
LLVVIAILGIMAGLTVPVLKNFAKSDATLGASRQLLDDVGRARQLAISQRTTVYMVFVPPNFWNGLSSAQTNTPAGMTAAINLCDKQLTGYTFVSLRSVGDQPGNPTQQYLAPWQTLPDGTFIATNKFIPPTQSFYVSQWDTDYNHASPVPINGLATNNFMSSSGPGIPFPTKDAPRVLLPFIAFNYLGQLTTDGADMAGSDEYIPIAKGSVLFARDLATKTFQFSSPDASEIPPGNSANSAYNIVHIDRLTGRAVLEYQKMQ